MFFLAVASYSCALYHVEDRKQAGALAKACVESGGEWVHDWRAIHDCVRKKP